MTPDEKRGYARGYAARTRKSIKEHWQADQKYAENKFWQATFTAALQAMITNGNWRFGDKIFTTVEDYIKGAAAIADTALRQHKGRI